MNVQTSTNGHSAPEEYSYHTHRSPELNRNNRRVGLIIVMVVLFLVAGTVAYVIWFGGANMAPQAPLHSGLMLRTAQTVMV